MHGRVTQPPLVCGKRSVQQPSALMPTIRVVASGGVPTDFIERNPMSEGHPFKVPVGANRV